MKLKIDGMSCQHCVMRVKNVLEEVEGVQSARVDLEQGAVEVVASAGVRTQTLIEAVQEAGYEASLVE